MKNLPLWERNHFNRFFVGLFLIYLIFMNPSPDTSYTVPQLHLAVSLVDQRSVGLSTYRGRDVAFYGGRFLSGHPPGAAFLAAGIYQIFRPIFPSRADEGTIFWLNTLSVVLISIPLGVLAALVFFRLVQMMPVKIPAIGWTLMVMALGAPSFPYSGGFYKKGMGGLVVFLAISIIWLQVRKSETSDSSEGLSPAWLFLTGLIAGFSVLIDNSMVVMLPFLVIYLWRKKIPLQKIVFFLAGGMMMALILLFYHQVAFGHPFRTSYSFRFHSNDSLQFVGFHPWIIWQRLFGIQCGIFVYMPILFLVFSGWLISVRNRIFREEMVWLICAPAVSYFLFYSLWRLGYWCGGESLIVRNVVPIFPLVMLPLAVGFDRAPRRISLPLAAVSLIFAYLAAQSFFFPADSFPLVNALKNAIASLGSGELFSRFFPRLLGLETPLSIPGGKISPLLSEPQRLLKLMSTQLAFSVVQFALIAGVWRSFIREPLRALGRDVAE